MKYILNNVIKSNYKPMIKKTKRGSKGYGTIFRNKIFNKKNIKKDGFVRVSELSEL